MSEISMKYYSATALMILVLCLSGGPGWCSQDTVQGSVVLTEDLKNPGDAVPPSVEQVLNHVQARYGTSGFCSQFSQVATLTGMGIQDTASGHVCFKYPDKMRWQYKTPEEQAIVSDGETLWVYRPLDNQVMIGKARDFFGAGEGASFFSDVKILKQRFDVSWAEQEWQNSAALQKAWALKLSPKVPNPEFVSLYLLIDKDSHEIFETASFNNFRDETRILFSKPTFDPVPGEEEFIFIIPSGVDVMNWGDQ